jgi:ribonuclease HI
MQTTIMDYIDVNNKKQDGGKQPPKKKIKIAKTKSKKKVAPKQRVIKSAVKNMKGPKDSRKLVHVFTDGSCYNNSRKSKTSAGGIGVFWGDGDYRNLTEPFYVKPITNNRAEIFAVIKAIEIFSISYDQKCSKQTLQINSDSQYLINTMTKWYKNWKRRGWKKADGKEPLNLDLLCHLDNLIEKHKKCFNIVYNHVRAHKSEPKDKNSIKYFEWYGNNQADLLANQGSKKYLSKDYCSK